MTLMTTNMTATAPREFSFGWMHRALTTLERWMETPSKRRFEQRVARIEQLRALSNDQLADLGLDRDRIPQHVFGQR